MKEAVRNFLVGLTSIIALLGLAALLLLFGELDRVIHPRYLLTINTDHASGLRPGSAVELNGVPIGVVDEILVQEHAKYPVRVRALIDQDVSIATTAEPFAAASLLGGASVLEIQMGPIEDDTRFHPHDDSAAITGPIRFRLFEQIKAELDARMEGIEAALDRFNTLSTTYEQVGKNLNELLGPQDETALAEGEAPNLRAAVTKLYEVLDTAEQALALARDWLGDEQMKADARAAVENAGTLIERASDTLDRFTALAGELEGDADELVKRLLPVADELAVTLEEIRRLTRLATEGEGTVALLLNNPDLYLSLEDAATRLEAALREVQLFIEKAKAEGLPINY
ncbi:MAG: MlaD family protein [Planctomycetota bacterium]|nr:MlaD family protein [Planctomycetota bacterium]